MSIFKRKPPVHEQKVPVSPVVYPSGTCVETESGRYYIKGNRRYRIKSEAVFKSWSFPLVCKSTDAAIANYKPSLRPLGFRDGTVIRDIFNLELFVISDGKRIKLTDPDMLEFLGLDNAKIPYASHEEVISHSEGRLD